MSGLKEKSFSRGLPTEVSGSPVRTLTSSFFIGLPLSLAVVASFWGVLGCDFINYDDDLYVTENRAVQHGLTLGGVKWAFTAMEASNWHPVTWLSHMLDVELFGLRPRGHHLTNLLLHLANTLLLFKLLRRLTGAHWRSAIVAALFALHPLHVESVAWVAERKDVLSTFFGLIALWFYVRYAESRIQNLRRRNYFLSILLFALGLMSKPMLVTLPFVMLLLDFWPLRRFAGWRVVQEKIPFVVLSAASCVVTVIAQKHGGAVQTLTQFSLVERVGNTFVSFARYLGNIFWPMNLALPYPHPGQWPVALVGLCFMLFTGLTIFVVAQRLRRPFLFVGWFLFLVTLLPVIGLVQVGAQSMADRYTYIPSIGIFIALVWLVSELATRQSALKIAIATATVLILAASAARTINQTGRWKNSETLFRHTLALTRDNEIALNNLAVAILDTGGRAAEAEKLCRELLKLRSQNADAWNNLGLALAEQKKFTEALSAYESALRIKPKEAAIQVNFANALIETGDVGRGLEELRAAQRLAPDNPQVYTQLGRALTLQTNHNEAIRCYEKAIQLSPFDWKTRHDLGIVLSAQGRRTEAIRQFRSALDLNPGAVEVRNSLGSALFEEGSLDDAIVQFREAVRIKPAFAPAHDNLGSGLASQGKFDEAVIQYREAIRLAPGEAKTHFNLGRVFSMRARFDEASQEFDEALRLAPELAAAKSAQAQLLFQRGLALATRGHKREAIGQWREALRVEPNQRDSLNGIAWTLATDNDAALRNGGEAVELAERLTREHPAPETFDTLAAAYAEMGRFADATNVAKKAIQLLGDSGNPHLATAIRSHLAAFESNKPWRE